MPSGNSALKHAIWLILGLGILFLVVWQAPALYTVQGLANYLPLHMFAETFSIVVSMMVFGVAWNAFSTERPGNTVILACALLAVGLIDFAHMLSFKGMPDFITPSSPEKAINLWLSARLIAALALLAAALRPWRLSRNVRARYLLLAVSLVVAATVIWLGLVYPQAWPRTFIAGQGLTPFKIGAEYAIIALLLIPAVLFYLQAKQEPKFDAAGLFTATAITILSELCFTLYSDVADIFNLLGHLYKIVAYVFIYRAVFMSSVHEPFQRVAIEFAENKRIAKELRAASLYTRSLIEASLDPLVTISVQGKITDINKATEQVTGSSRAELIGADFSDYFTEPDKARAGYRQVFDKGYVTDYPLALRHRDGHVTDVLYNASVYRDETGEVQGVFAAARDITERKRTEAALRESEHFLETIVEHIPNMLFVKDAAELKFVRFNKAGEQLLGYARDDLIGISDRDLFPQEQADFFISKDREILASGEMLDIAEEPIDTKNLGRRYLHTRKIPIYADDGSPLYLLGISDDITERKQAEIEHQASLHFFESMNRVSKAIQGTDDLEQMMRDVLGIVLEIFDCDRVWLFYPCDPDAPVFRVPMEITKPEYPGAGIMNVDLPMPAEMAQNLRETLEADAPVTYIVGTEKPVNKMSAEQFGVKSQIMGALHPKSGKPWAFGLHQCAYPRIWSQEDVRLFHEIGRRLSDGLSSLLSHRDLQASEAKYRRIVDTATEGVLALDLNVIITFVNARMADMFGYSSEEMMGRSFTDFMFKEDMPDHLQRMENRHQGRSEVYERRFLRKDGDVVWTLVSATPVFDDQHRYQGSFGMFTDITERKRMEESLRDNERFLDNLIEHLPNMLFVKDAGKLKFIRFNKAGEQLLGYARDELIGKNDYDFFPKEQADFFVSKDRAIIASGEMLDIPEEPISTKLQGQRFLHTRKIPIYAEDGKPLYLLGISEDITERKLEEEHLRRSEQGLAEAQRIAHMGNWELDLLTNALSWSDEIFRIFEIDPEKFGASYDAFLNAIHPDDRELVNNAYAESLKNKTPYEIVHRLLMRDGRIKFVIEKSETHYDDDGKPLRSIGTVHDITERKQAEDEIKSLNRDLEQRVEERTEQLEAANKELEAFSYSVSHDLRTPLRAIDGFSHILLEEYTGKLDAEGQRLLNVVRDNTHRMGQLIDDILKFSRSGRVEMKLADIDMAQQAREVLAELHPGGDSDKLQIEIEAIPPAKGDSAMMRQVFVNLLSNAVKFSHAKEHPAIKVGAYAEGNEVVYYVKDNGAGFDMQYAGKLFGVFQRLHSVEEFEGTGIGLAIVKRIINRHGGRVWAEGKVGEGATFYFSLPAIH